MEDVLAMGHQDKAVTAALEDLQGDDEDGDETVREDPLNRPPSRSSSRLSISSASNLSRPPSMLALSTVARTKSRLGKISPLFCN